MTNWEVKDKGGGLKGSFEVVDPKQLCFCVV